MAAPEHVPTSTAAAGPFLLLAATAWQGPGRRTVPVSCGAASRWVSSWEPPAPTRGTHSRLAERFSGRLALSEGEHEADALAGAAGIAMKRSALFGRAPVIHDMTVGLTIWGFLDATAAPELVELRREWFEEVHLAMHYTALQQIVDAAPEPVLRLTHQRSSSGTAPTGGPVWTWTGPDHTDRPGVCSGLPPGTPLIADVRGRCRPGCPPARCRPAAG